MTDSREGSIKLKSFNQSDSLYFLRDFENSRIVIWSHLLLPTVLLRLIEPQLLMFHRFSETQKYSQIIYVLVRQKLTRQHTLALVLILR